MTSTITNKYINGYNEALTTSETISQHNSSVINITNGTIRIKAGGNANDIADGTSARAIVVTGLDASGNYQTSTIATAGALASASTTEEYARILTAYVSASGSKFVNSAGDITIETTAGIEIAKFDGGEFLSAHYTAPLGKKAYLRSLTLSSSANPATISLLSTLDSFSATSIIKVLSKFNVGGGESININFEKKQFIIEPLQCIYFVAVAGIATAVSVHMHLEEFNDL